jgi:hypothetical protein
VISRTSYDRNTFKQATAAVKFFSRLACEHPNIRRHITPAVYKTPLNSWKLKVLYNNAVYSDNHTGLKHTRRRKLHAQIVNGVFYSNQWQTKHVRITNHYSWQPLSHPLKLQTLISYNTEACQTRFEITDARSRSGPFYPVFTTTLLPVRGVPAHSCNEYRFIAS